VREKIPITHLHHVGIRVPNPHATAAFYRRVLGLGETGREPSSGAIRLSVLPRGAIMVSHHELILYPGEPVRVDHLGLAVADDSALTHAAHLLRARGLQVDGPRDFEGVHGPSVRVRDPDDLTVELMVPPPAVSRPAGPSPFHLIKLAHVNVKSADPPGRARWWQDVMDFRLSDQMGETFYWLRCNRDHTSVAIVRSSTPGIHHLALEIDSWDEIRRLGDHFMAHDVPVEFGPGRHGPGHSIFLYFLDPWSIRWEFLCELERIDDETGHRPKFWHQERRANTVNLWGPSPPETFLKW